MRILIYGAGAIGGYIGASLISSGESVVLVARGEHYKKIYSDGLTLTTSGESTTVRPQLIIDKIQDAPPEVDLVVISVKAWQVPEVALAIRSLISSRTVLMTVQNGVEIPNQIAQIFDENQVVAGVFKGISELVSPGVISYTNKGHLTLGNINQNSVISVNNIADIIRKAGLDVVVTNDIQLELWRKLAMMAPMSGIGAITRSPVGKWRSVEGTRQMAADAIKEIVEVAQAQQIDLPIETVTNLLKFYDNLNSSATASMQRDIESGKPSELEYQNGAVVRIGNHYGVPVPVNTYIYNTLIPQEIVARDSVDDLA